MRGRRSPVTGKLVVPPSQELGLSVSGSRATAGMLKSDLAVSRRKEANQWTTNFGYANAKLGACVQVRCYAQR